MNLKRLQEIKLNIFDEIGKIEKLIGKEGDNLTRGLEVQLLHNSIVVDDISDIDCVLIAKPRGKGPEDTFVVPAIKEDGKYEIIYPTNLMKSGIVEAELRFSQGENTLTSFIFEIDMARTLVAEDIVDSIYEQRLIDVIVDVVANEESRIQSEDDRESNELARESNENTRIANETEREDKESTRQANETARISNENAREGNEETRQSNESVRKSNEIDRIDYYELIQQKVNDGDFDGEVDLAQLEDLAGAGRTNETVKGNADKIANLMAEVGELDNLETVEKANLVLSLNEVYQELVAHQAENVNEGNPHGIDGKADVIQEEFITANLINGWTHSSPKLSYFKDNFGFTHISGRCSSGSDVSNGVVIFVLPEGYRPLLSLISGFAVRSQDGSPIYINVTGSSGEVRAYGLESTNTLGINLSFRSAFEQ